MSPSRRRRSRGGDSTPQVETLEQYMARERDLWVPDIMEFTLSDQFLGRNIYPRQATMLKIAFLQDELFTDYDYEVIDGWIKDFTETGDNGCQPDIFERIAICKAEGRPWFREWPNVLGRRGSKGFIGAIAGSYVLWNYVCRRDPQAFYGIDRDKRLSMMVFGAKKEQALVNQWKDLTDVIKGAPCFSPYISRSLNESLTIFAPHDFERVQNREDMGVHEDGDMATFIILPKESTVVASRGPAVFCLDPQTPVLKSDLNWVPIKDIQPGDQLVSLDEYPQTANQQRKLREATVVGTHTRFGQALKLHFDDGSSVVCSPEHKWLYQESSRGCNQSWREASWLKVGHRIRHLVDPWVEKSTRDAGYLAGFFDGEGCIVTSERRRMGASILFSQNPGVVLDKVLDDLDRYDFKTQLYTKQAKCYQMEIRGVQQCLRFLGEINPVRLRQHHRYVWEGLTLRASKSGSGYKTIVAIEELPEQELIDIQTTTGTFIANGLVSHNCMMFDEMAHVVRQVAKSDASEVYQAASPALDTFGVDAFLYEPSSPWAKTGQFYENWEQSLAVSDGTDGQPAGTILRPEMLMFQLASWDTYVDWDRANEISVMPDDVYDEPFMTPSSGKHEGRKFDRFLPSQIRPQQAYDDQMKRIEAANPETFAVERRSHWAAVMDAYLNEARVRAIFEPWPNEDRPLNAIMKAEGKLAILYKAHGDPSKSNANFGFAIAHVVRLPKDNFPHVVFDYITHWSPGDFADNDYQIDYDYIEKRLKHFIDKFVPAEFSLDQGYSNWMLSRLNKWVRTRNYPRQVQVLERTANMTTNWTIAETFKTAIGLGLVHAPPYEQVMKELFFLQLVNEKKVDHPTSGPVQTKDVADCLMILVHALIGDEIAAFIGDDLASLRVGGGASGGMPLPSEQAAQDTAGNPLSALSSWSGGGVNTQSMADSFSPARGRNANMGRENRFGRRR